MELAKHNEIVRHGPHLKDTSPPIKHLPSKKQSNWDFPEGPVVETLPLQRVQVPSLVGELRSYMPCNAARKLIN